MATYRELVEIFGRDGIEFFDDMFDYPAPRPRMNLLAEYPHLPQIEGEYGQNAPHTLQRG